MKTEFEQYANNFHVNLRVEIGIPLSREEVFRDWAIVTDYFDDNLSVELSRDELPRRVKLAYGSIVDVGLWRGQEVYTCQAIVMEKIGQKNLKMRLISAITLKDRRQFYRLNASLRIRYSLPDSKKPAYQVEQEWDERRREEIEALRVRMGEHDVVLEEFMKSRKSKASPVKLVWLDGPGSRGVIGGGGIGFRLHKQMKRGDLVDLELHLPLLPFRIVHAVAEVIYVLEPIKIPGIPEPVFHTGMQFLHLDERDRDHIIEFISQVELEKLREMSEHRQVREADQIRLEKNVKTARGREKLINLIFVIVVIVAGFFIVTYLLSYKSKHHEDEIGREFQKSLTR